MRSNKTFTTESGYRASSNFVEFNPTPTSDEEANAHGNALAATGNYPVGTSNCFNVGISGGCGVTCFAYWQGECEESQENWGSLDSDDDKHEHVMLYGIPIDVIWEQE